MDISFNPEDIDEEESEKAKNLKSIARVQRNSNITVKAATPLRESGRKVARAKI